MKTIEKKAKEYSQEFGSAELQEVSYNSFVCGASTQKKIDEDSFCPIIEESVLKSINKQKKIDIEKACEWLMNYFKNGDFIQHYSVDNFIKNFRKAMEGGEV